MISSVHRGGVVPDAAAVAPESPLAWAVEGLPLLVGGDAASLSGARPAGSCLYVRIGGAAAVRRIADEFYLRVLAEADLAAFFGAEPGVLKWHQAGQVCRAVEGPDRLATHAPAGGYAPVVVAPVLYHRATACLLAAVLEALSGGPAVREAFCAVGSAVARRRCRIIAGQSRPGVLVAAQQRPYARRG